MKEVQAIMGTSVVVNIRDSEAKKEFFEEVFAYFRYVDDKFSTYKQTSEITKINNKEISDSEMSEDMKTVFRLSLETHQITNGYFDIIDRNGLSDPSGLVKGWSIFNAANILKKNGVKNFFVEAGGDIQACGKNDHNEPWVIGIQSPFSAKKEIVKKVQISDKGVATSGTYILGQHIYNPKNIKEKLEEIVSLTVIGPNIYEADRFATAAFAMGYGGVEFIEKLDGFEAYSIDKEGIATMTTGFNNYVK